MRLIARSEGPKRLTITPDRHGKPWFPRAVDNGETIGSDDVEYVRADIHRGAVAANDDAFQVICDALSALHPPQARELMETPSYKAFAAFYKRGQ